MEDMSKYASKYNRPDIERIGLFIEMPYLNGKGYVSPFPKSKKAGGRGIYAEGRKSKNGTQHGYFEPEFKRLFVGEGLLKKMPEKGKKQKGKTVSDRPFMPASGSKWHSTPGDYYGTFSGNIEYFSNKRHPKPKYKRQLRNILTSPGKKGGPGYEHITGLSQYPKHFKDPYRLPLPAKAYGTNLGRPMCTAHYPKAYFDDNPYMEPSNVRPGYIYVRPKEKNVTIIPPGKFIPTGPSKWQGGCHDGCFNKFPIHMTDRQTIKHNKQKKKESKYFYPQSMGLITLQTPSVLNYCNDFRVNKTNYQNYEPTYTKRLL